MQLLDEIEEINRDSRGFRHAAAWVRPDDGIETAIRDGILALARWAQVVEHVHSIVALTAVMDQLPYVFQFEAGRFERDTLYKSLFRIRKYLTEATQKPTPPRMPAA